MSNLRLTGTLTAIVTPFTADGESVDVAALDALIEAQIQGGVSGLVPCGTTGESPTGTSLRSLGAFHMAMVVPAGTKRKVR